MTAAAEPTPSFTLQIERTLAAPRAAVWRCWTEPALLRQWYCPKPWGVSRAEIDLRPGGRFLVHMQGPQGEAVAVPGVYLAVEPGHRLVFTDAFERAWQPSGRAFMVGEVQIDDASGGHTRYVARAHHWSAKDRDEHAAMGFEDGWNAAASQLEELARSLG